MATTAISSPFPDDQQQQQQAGDQEVVPVPGAAVSNNGWHSSGSIGPFFAVISVLTVLAIISCILGRICRGRRLTPLESIKYRGCSSCGFGPFGWFRRKCCPGQVLGNNKVVVVVHDGQKENNIDVKAQDAAV